MTSLVDVTELARELGPFDAAETARATGFLEEASDLAREIGRAIWTGTAGATPAPVSVRLVVKAAARRAFNEDPDGYSDERLGEWNGKKLTGNLDDTGVYFTPGEERRIRAAAGRPSGAFSVRTPSAYGAGPVTDTVYVPVSNPSGEPFPFLALEDLA